MSNPNHQRFFRSAGVSLALAALPAVILGIVGVSYLQHEKVIAERAMTEAAQRYAMEISQALTEAYHAHINSDAVASRAVRPESIQQFRLPEAGNSEFGVETYQAYKAWLSDPVPDRAQLNTLLPDFARSQTPVGLPLLPIAQLRIAERFLDKGENDEGAKMLKQAVESIVVSHPSMISSELLVRAEELAQQWELGDAVNWKDWRDRFAAMSGTREVLYRNQDYLRRFGNRYPWFQEGEKRLIRIFLDDGKAVILSKAELETLAGDALERIIENNAIRQHPLAFRLQFENQKIDPRPFHDPEVREAYFEENGFNPITHTQSGTEWASAGTATPFRIRIASGNRWQFDRAIRERVMKQGAFLGLVMSCLGFGIWMTWRTMKTQQELTQCQSNLISAISHELRTPVAGIRLMAERIAEQAGSGGTQEKYSQLIVKESDRLGSLIANILDTGRITDGRKTYRVEWTDLGELVRDTVDRMQPLAVSEEKNIDCRIGGSVFSAQVDPIAVQQALGNLIENALKFSEEGSVVTVTLEAASEDWLQLRVVDEGCGIRSGDQGKIFDLFFRAAPGSEGEFAGTGLGLHLVKHIVEGHGGTIDVDSTPGEGTAFAISLPKEQKGGA